MAKKQAAPRSRIDRASRRRAIELATTRVEAVVERSPAFASLSAKRKKRFLERVRRLITVVAGPDDLRPPHRMGVDYPEFVADLIGGVFDAIVDASIRQMEAYTSLVRDATRAVDEFARLSRSRQQLLATMVLMGIGRVQIDDDRIAIRPCADEDDD